VPPAPHVLPPAALAPPPPPPTASAEPPPAAREDGRLPALALPERYALTLAVDPDQERFQGEVKILLFLASQTPYLVMHGRDLHVTEVVARAGTETFRGTATARVAHEGLVPEELVLGWDRPLPQGTVTLEIAYDAPFADSLTGLYRVKEGGRNYAFTEFEATDARRAFPCFDEPGWKTPWDVTIKIPKGMLAFANAPEIGHEDVGASTIVRFATTLPLPSYLVAFAVGDFDVREGPRTPVPIRLIATKGKGALGDVALEATAALTQKLSEYFALPYPYAKLDVVAVPDFDAGAMENAGLITFRDELLLIDPKRATVRARRALEATIAHELAHQWFGDLVTMRWWNDLWLNEGFATWAEAKILDTWKPAYQTRLQQMAGFSDVMDTDALPSARAIRQPVASTSEAMEAFDDITYEKGAAVLTMLEHAVGDGAFQSGVRTYLQDHAWRTATADDLMRALGTASGKDVSAMAASFLDRPGVPGVRAKFRCEKRDAGYFAKWSLAETAWRPLIDGPVTWWTPAHAGAAFWNVQVELDTPVFPIATGLLETSPAAEVEHAGCPDWFEPNASFAGYYRYSLDEKPWEALFRSWAKLPVLARLSALENLWAGVRAGATAPTVLLRLLPTLDRETDRHVVEREVSVLAGVGHALVEERARPAFRSYVAARMAPHEARILRGSASGPDDDRTLLARSVTWALAELADDERTLTAADGVARRWLNDPSSVDADVAEAAVGQGSRHARQERVRALHELVGRATTPQDRAIAAAALGGFEDRTVLASALDVSLADDARTEDTSRIILAAADHRVSRAAAIDWTVANWDRIKKKLPDGLSGRLFDLAAFACTAVDRERMSAFFGPKTKEVPGTERPLAEALERASSCIALHERGSRAVTEFLNPNAARPLAGPKK